MKTFSFCFGIWMESRPACRGHSPRVETAKIWSPRSVPKTCDKNANDSEGGQPKKGNLTDGTGGPHELTHRLNRHLTDDA